MENNKNDKVVLNRFYSDSDFRKRMMADPKTTMEEEGLDASNDLVERFNSISPETIERTMDSFHNGSETPLC